ncbi:MAG: hypothetical protein JXR60_04200 [Bacteroidales bacterium]|nr:hypothetical protein [Bacteroidales bacterium]
MNIQEFEQYIDHPESLNASHIADLQEILKRYPYFQSAHFLYLKALYNQNNFRFNDQLKQSAIQIQNRRQLLYYIKNDIQSLTVTLPNAEETPVLIEVVEHAKKDVAAQIGEPIIDDDTDIKVETNAIEESKKVVTPKEEQDYEIDDNTEELPLVTQVDSEIIAELVIQENDEEPHLTDIFEENETTNNKQEETVETLSPSEILAKRLKEIQSSSQTFVEDNASAKSSENLEQKEDIVEKQQQILTNPDENRFAFLTQKWEDEHTPLSEEIEDLVYVAPPAEYFSGELGVKTINEESQNENKGEIKSATQKHSFEDWLNFLQKKPITIKPEYEEIEHIDKEKIIEKFLKDKRPKTIRPKENNDINEVSKTIENSSPSDFMTETLAKIYIQQGHYEKAIEAYVKLSLKYPKKNSYFASQIENIKQLQLKI